MRGELSRRRAGRDWIPLSSSALAHVALLVGAVALQHRSEESDPTHHLEQRDLPPPVQMIYLPPPEVPPVPPPAPAPRRVVPPPARPQPDPEPEANAPPEAERQSGSESEEPSPAGAGEAAGQPASAPRPAVKEEATLESEARRIFGRPRLATPAGAGPQAVRPMEAYVPDHPERCMPEPRDPGAEPQFGTVVGKIFRQDNGRPLAGAHLQMLGAPYVAFTDDNGEYRFRFDLALVDNCRTQYVRISARGYETRLLVLVVGPNARSEDVTLRRR